MLLWEYIKSFIVLLLRFQAPISLFQRQDDFRQKKKKKFFRKFYSYFSFMLERKIWSRVF